MKEDLLKQLIRHEGLCVQPYHDTVGKLTIGVGRNLDDVGISKDEAMYLLSNDLKRTIADLKSNILWFKELDEVRQDVLINMAFNMGIYGLLKFKNTLKSIENGNYAFAAEQMLQSKWAKQVGSRAAELSEQMKTGERRKEI